MKKKQFKEWHEYTEKEINVEKKKRCLNCPYKAALTGIPKRTSYGDDYWKLNHIFCNYAVINNKLRGCHPFECEHYKDKVTVIHKNSDEYIVKEVK